MQIKILSHKISFCCSKDNYRIWTTGSFCPAWSSTKWWNIKKYLTVVKLLKPDDKLWNKPEREINSMIYTKNNKWKQINSQQWQLPDYRLPAWNKHIKNLAGFNIFQFCEHSAYMGQQLLTTEHKNV